MGHMGHMHACHRHGSRILWFVFGAGAATWFFKHRDAEYHFKVAHHCSRHQIPQHAYPAPPPVPQPPMIPSVEQQTEAPSKPALPMPTEKWDEDKERAAAFSKQASDRFSEMSEATLDAVLNTVQSLKAKLAEHRAEREQQWEQLQQLQTIREEQAKQFEEWKKQMEQYRKQPEVEKQRRLV
ncbi:hypothetical protein CERSUDRAFT_112577 [Gelatoporia subvermispora B]|uniref:Uncharacterized protein n=1 Tax=Ceriporiopsis subvermispora (strain B) TaxID=914234 RepID=M2RJ59_CERS8|nr:hypothetical protein CERSUDRAFT_112577 [Gelatoporia subvermispora B]